MNLFFNWLWMVFTLVVVAAPLTIYFSYRFTQAVSLIEAKYKVHFKKDPKGHYLVDELFKVLQITKYDDFKADLVQALAFEKRKRSALKIFFVLSILITLMQITLAVYFRIK